MKLAVIVPGIGYFAAKPLLYYAGKLAQSFGYEVKEIAYSNLPKKVKGSPEMMQKAFEMALEQTEEQLKDVDFSACEKLMFLSKSVGTAVAAAFESRHGLKAANIFYTPVEATFLFADRGGIVFHGTKDPWIETELVVNACREKKLPLYITEGANHSLETGDVMRDLQNLQTIMEQSRVYMAETSSEEKKQVSGADAYLICNTTRAQREQIVRESLGYSDIGCEDSADGYEMYLPYIEGKKELREITMEYHTNYVKYMEREERGRCEML